MRLAVMRKFALCALILLTLAGVAHAGAATAGGGRYALVIGNSAYKDKPLKNPANDARDMASTLGGLGFTVQLKVDAGLKDMDEAIREFGNRLKKGGVGIFYYAGHGIQVSGVNYLVPIGARLSSESDAKYECVDAGRVLGKMEDAGNELNIVILDACRNNPFARSFRSADQGLARMDAPTGSMVAYSTAPNSVASDGSGKNGVYTKHLLSNLGTPGIPIEEVFKRVRIGVMEETGKKQVPWESSSIAGYYYIAGGQGAPMIAPSAKSASSSQSAQAVAQANAERLKQEQRLKEYIAGLEAEKKQVESERAELARRRQALDDEEAARRLAEAQAPQEKRLKEQLAVLEGERKKLEQERAALERTRKEAEQAQKAAVLAEQAAQQARKSAQAAKPAAATAAATGQQAAPPQKSAPSAPAKAPAPRRMDREAVLQRLAGTWRIETQGGWNFPALSLKPGGDTLYGSLEGDRRVVDRVDLTGLAVEGDDLHLRLAVHQPGGASDRGFLRGDPRQRQGRAVATRQASKARVVECVGDLGAPGADDEIPVVCRVEGPGGVAGRSEPGRSESGRMVRSGW